MALFFYILHPVIFTSQKKPHAVFVGVSDRPHYTKHKSDLYGCPMQCYSVSVENGVGKPFRNRLLSPEGGDIENFRKTKKANLGERKVDEPS